MKRFQGLLNTILALTLMLLMTVPAFAAESDTEKYMETHFQINFSDFNVNVSENELTLTVKEPIAISRDTSVAMDLAMLDKVFEEFPGVEEELISEYQSEEELHAVSFTIVPLMAVDGHYERVPAKARGYEYSEENGNGKFLMSTSISGGISSVSGGYEYTAKTSGWWSNNIIGGSDYPDAGADYVFQTSPNTFSRISDEIYVGYDHSPTAGVKNDDYWRENGDATYVRYAIQDDPLGYRQCDRLFLTTVSAGPKSSKYRQIGSYYVHTWDEMTIDVSVSVSTDKSVSLDITPGNVMKSWQVYNYVSFDF